MKQLIITLITGIISCHSYAQMITIDEAIACQAKSIPEFERFLTSKKWELFKVVKPETEKENKRGGAISFSYKRNDINNAASGFITLYELGDTKKSNVIEFQISSKDLYSSFLTRIKALGAKLKESNLINDGLFNNYWLKSLKIGVLSGTLYDKVNQTTKNYYKFLITSIEDIERDDEVKKEKDNDITISNDISTDVARHAFNQENYKTAINLFKDLIDKGLAEDIDIYYLAYSYYSLKQYQSAITNLNLFLNKSVDDIDALKLLADSYFRIGNLKYTIQKQMKVCEISNSVEDINTLAWFLILDKQYEKALDYVTKAEELHDSKNDNLFYHIKLNKAHTYLLTNRLESAKLIYSKYVGTPIEESIWDEYVKEDFKTMKSHKIIIPTMSDILALFK